MGGKEGTQGGQLHLPAREPLASDERSFLETWDSASHSKKAGQSWTEVPWAHVWQTRGRQPVAAMKESLVVSQHEYLVPGN